MTHHTLQVTGIVDVEFQTHWQWGNRLVNIRLQATLYSLLLGHPGVYGVEQRMRTTIVPGLKLLLTFLATLGQVVILQSFPQFPDWLAVPYFADGIFRIDAEHLLPVETTCGNNTLLRKVQVDRGRWTRRGTGRRVSDAIEFFNYFGGKHKF